jgi:DNA-directed RNA polymerase subunit RPC12/RpoP
MFLGPADLGDRETARGMPDICSRCKAAEVKSWTFIGTDTVTAEAVYLCSRCAGEVLEHNVT